MKADFDQSLDFDVGLEIEESEASIELDQDIEVEFDNARFMLVDLKIEEDFKCDFGTGISSGDYKGAYEVTPTASEQTLPTENKTMERNVTVHATPYSEVSNIYGGTTVTIL
ncbi:MAG: hypothetical protein IKE23_12070 [Exiguobacterium sp.]|nr:hypothetical protein [Exiguobacterium sp.]